MSDWTRSGLILGLAFAISGSASVSARAENVTWTYYSVITAQHEAGQALTAAFDRISERTNGEFKINFVSYGETPHKATDALQVMKDGLVEMTEWIPAYTTGTYPILGGPGLPFLLPDFSDTAKAQAGADAAWEAPAMQAELNSIFDEHGASPMGSYYYEPMNFYFTTPVEGYKDFDGKRMRVFSPELSTLAQELSAAPVSLPAPEVYSALQRNSLDSVITSSGGVVGLKWSEQLKSVYLVNMLMVRTDILASRSALENLPEEFRAVLTDEMGKAGTELRELLTELDKKNFQTMRDMGFTFASSEGEEYTALRKISQEKVWPQWAERLGDKGKTVIDDMLSSVSSN